MAHDCLFVEITGDGSPYCNNSAETSGISRLLNVQLRSFRHQGAVTSADFDQHRAGGRGLNRATIPSPRSLCGFAALRAQSISDSCFSSFILATAYIHAQLDIRTCCIENM
jgi:hypothetical protein